MANEDIQNLLKSGIQAAKSGNKEVARSIFDQVIRLDSQNEVAWMWLASVVDSPAERLKALQRVVTINPKNEKAQQALAKLQQPGQAAPKAAPPPEPAARLRPSEPPPPPPKKVTSELVSPEAMLMREAAARRREAVESQNTFLYLVGGAIVLLLLGAALVLAYLQLLDEQDSTATPVVGQIPTVLATRLPPSNTPRPISTIPPEQVINLNSELPATWTPSPTVTAEPSLTPTLPPSDPAPLQLVFSGRENPAALSEIWVVQGGGSNLDTLDITLTAADITLVTVGVPPSDEVQENVSPGDLTDATEAPEGETTPAPEPAFDRIEFTDPAWSPDGRLVAFTAQISANVQEIFIFDTLTEEVRQLTRLGASLTDGAAWSPDGALVAFSSNYDPALTGAPLFDIYTIEVDSGDLVNLTTGAGQNREPAWSPDGQTIVFSSDRNTPGELEIWSLPLNSTIPVQLTNAVGYSSSPAFSPDGSQIAFISNRSGDNDLYIMQADGTAETLVTLDDDDADDRDPAWSPDGDWVVLSSNREGARVLELWLVTPDGRNWQPIATNLGESRYAVWRTIDQ